MATFTHQNNTNRNQVVQDLADRFVQHAQNFPEQLALITDTAQLTYSQLHQKARSLVRRAEKHAPVASTWGIYIKDKPKFVTAYLAACLSGHPYGASGAVIVTRLFHQMCQVPEPGQTGLGLIAAAGGVGNSILVKTVSPRGE